MSTESPRPEVLISEAQGCHKKWYKQLEFIVHVLVHPTSSSNVCIRASRCFLLLLVVQLLSLSSDVVSSDISTFLCLMYELR